jgi:hypothetical protein
MNKPTPPQIPPGMEASPHPHHPNIKKAEDGLFCFKDGARACGSDCMAYIHPPEGPDYKDQQWANCLLLVNAHRSGKHLVILADVTAKLLNHTRNKAADEARTNQPAVPPVR